MTYLPLALAAVLAACAPAAPPASEAPAEGSRESPADSVADWSAAFAAEGAVGTFVVYDTATGRTTRHDPARAAARYSPASTSKVWNALVFLDRGVVTDVDSMHTWDGVERRVRAWNRDHSLRTGVETSAVWLFQRDALEVGRAGYLAVLAREPYGNSVMGEPLEMAWLDGSLQVSPNEQVVFFDRLRRGDLAFSAEHQATVRDLLPTLAEADAPAGRAVLKGKTGWSVIDGQPDRGWLVGWVERPRGDPDGPGQAVVYALHIEAAPGADLDMGSARLRLAKALLEEAGVWPAEPGGRP